MADKPINGAEMKEFHERVRIETLRQLDQIKLRQWCVEQAVKVADHYPVRLETYPPSDNQTTVHVNIETLPKLFYDFITDKETPHAKSS